MDPGTRPLKDAGYFLVVRFWIAPGGEPQVMRQPGFPWARRAHAIIYGIDSRASYEKYMVNQTLHARFAGDADLAL